MSGNVGGITGGLLAAFSIRVAQACACVGAASAFALQAAFAFRAAFFRAAALHGHAGRGCAPLGLRARFFLGVYFGRRAQAANQQQAEQEKRRAGASGHGDIQCAEQQGPDAAMVGCAVCWGYPLLGRWVPCRRWGFIRVT